MAQVGFADTVQGTAGQHSTLSVIEAEIRSE
jgi:hypothetical protein